jgi:hypothetical protein
MEDCNEENYFPVIVRIISDKTVRKWGQQKFQFYGVLSEDVEGLDDSSRRACKIATSDY